MASNGNGHNGNGKELAVIDPEPPSERDLQMFEQALGGTPTHTLAKNFGITAKQVDAALIKCCRPFDAESVLLSRMLGVARWERVWATWYPLALAGNAAATALLVKIDERRSALAGADVPAAMRASPIALQINVNPPETSSEKFDRVYAQLTGKIFDGEKYVDPKPKPDDSSAPEAKPEPPSKPE